MGYASLRGIVPGSSRSGARGLLWTMFAPFGFLASLYLRSLRARSRRPDDLDFRFVAFAVLAVVSVVFLPG